MAQEADVPPGFWKQIGKMIDDKIAGFARSGFLRNASITGGAGLSIRDGGRLALVDVNGTVLFDIGPVEPSRPDGTPQPGWVVRRSDGTVALAMFDAFPDPDGTLNQALNIYDRAGNVVLADDTDSGQGVARPYVGGGFTAFRFGDFRHSTTSSTFETVAIAWVTKQHPRLRVTAQASMDATGTTGELRVLVGGVQLGPTATVGFGIGTHDFGPAPIAGSHLQRVVVEIQGRRTSATGALRIDPMGWEGQQT